MPSTTGEDSLVRELILNLHGLGEPHPLVDAQERRYWWSPISFARLLDQILDRPADVSPKISITLDDGNASDAVVALPELAKRGLTASFFVCAGRIGKKYYLDKAMIGALLDSGMSIGSHGMYHRDWRGLDTPDLEMEIVNARRILEDVTGRAVTTVAIPFGSYDRRVLRWLKRDRWDCIYTSDRGTARVEAKMKRRETLDADMQARDILRELEATRSVQIRISQTMSRFYKRWR